MLSQPSRPEENGTLIRNGEATKVKENVKTLRHLVGKIPQKFTSGVCRELAELGRLSRGYFAELIIFAPGPWGRRREAIFCPGGRGWASQRERF